MFIDEAIKIKEQVHHWLPKEPFPDFIEADRLSIEALKRILEKHEDDELLPGETPSGETTE